MKILIACEFSGVVRNAFCKKGHDVTSCDILPGDNDLFEKPLGKHYNGSVFDIIDDGWDMMIGHPPCTYLSYAANRVWNSPGRAEKREQALEFFKKLWNCGINKICLENPKSYAITFRRQDQIIQPYQFGEPFKKTTYLWLKNLPKLKHTNVLKNYESTKNGKWYNVGGTIERQKRRSKTFRGIANAMAEQWG